MDKALTVAAILWPVLLVSGTAARMSGQPSWLGAVTYVAAGAVCHQRPDRSFHTHGVQWPVCARCSGLYIAAPVGAVAVLAMHRRFRRTRDLTWLGVAALPTAIVFVLEHAGLAQVTSLARFVAALPLGAAIAWVIVAVAAGHEQVIE